MRKCEFQKMGTSYFYIIAAVPIILYYLFVFTCAINIPIMDDYDAILGFANNFFSGSHNKLALLFSQHNEHRILFCRCLTALSCFLTGSVNFRILAIIGNFSLFAFIAVVFASTVFSGKKIKPLYFLPVCFLLFQPPWWEAGLMAMSALTCLTVYFFAYSALHLLNWPSRKCFIVSLLIAAFAAFVNGNGMFIFPCGLLMLWFYKRPGGFLIWFLGGITITGLYFLGYVRPDCYPLGAVVHNPIAGIKFFFYFISSSLSFFIPSGMPFRQEVLLSAGALIFLYFLFLFTKIRARRVNITTVAFIAYLLLTAFIVTLCRAGFGANYALSHRYMLYSYLFLIFSYISFIEFSSERVLKVLFPVLLASAIFINFYAYIKSAPELFSIKRKALANLTDWRLDNKQCLVYPDCSRASSIMREAIKKGLYKPPV